MTIKSEVVYKQKVQETIFLSLNFRFMQKSYKLQEIIKLTTLSWKVTFHKIVYNSLLLVIVENINDISISKEIIRSLKPLRWGKTLFENSYDFLLWLITTAIPTR